ncbi:hypothetical protein CIPAW_10G141100 [Carya illinoinensis]|uniref:Reverse transcriptase zinc-binding domain-containing protein n=1 Tax=Carya illinoinensis TaxID=32201 RepID=A0A8T1PHH2_CARIL|nr:hypothetical protein CIPAW_10G141100 [Carya illinoinensis]
MEAENHGNVQYFIWRACHESLPTKSNLVLRKVVEDPLCPICQRDKETTIHALWTCPSATDVVIHKALKTVEEYKEAQINTQLLPAFATHRDLARWRRPGLNQLKMNWDGAVDSTMKKWGLGIVIRAESGELMSNCDGWQISFNYRETNIVAHLLARHALSLEEEYVWMEECHIHVLSAVLHDQCN